MWFARRRKLYDQVLKLMEGDFVHVLDPGSTARVKTHAFSLLQEMYLGMCYKKHGASVVKRQTRNHLKTKQSPRTK